LTLPFLREKDGEERGRGEWRNFRGEIFMPPFNPLLRFTVVKRALVGFFNYNEGKSKSTKKIGHWHGIYLITLSTYSLYFVFSD